MTASVGDLLLRLLEHHPETLSHCVNVSRLCRKIGVYLRLDSSDQRDLVLAGLTHDVGKVAVPPSVLDEPNQLDDWGRGEIERHPREGFELVKPILGERVASLVVSHHEPGYPRSEIRETEANLPGFLRLADQMDALLSCRAYKPAFTIPAAREIFKVKGHDEDLTNYLLESYKGGLP